MMREDSEYNRKNNQTKYYKEESETSLRIKESNIREVLQKISRKYPEVASPLSFATSLFSLNNRFFN